MRNIPAIFVVFAATTACGQLTAYGENTDSGATAPSTTPLGNPVGDEDCTDGTDDDGDGDIDCDDADCAAVCDVDADGFVDANQGGDDCNDGDATVYPGAAELCDQIDNNCDMFTDEDTDGDGADACADCDEGNSNIFPGAPGEVCDDNIDTDCDGDDCVPAWSTGFEGGIGPEWALTGAQNWFQTNDFPYDGAAAAQSGNITHNRVTTMTVTLLYATDGEISFWHSGSTESNYDEFTFSVDGTVALTRSGSWNWTYVSYPITAGVHVMEWKYDKDGDTIFGTDSVSVDLVTAVNGVISP